MSTRSITGKKSVPAFAPPVSPLEHMIRALDDEMDAVRRRSRANIITLMDGVRISSDAESTVYRFTIEGSLSLRDDARALCTLDDQHTAGVVLSARDGVLLLSVPLDLGPVIRSARLALDNAWLLAHLQHRLRELRKLGRAPALAAVDRLLRRAPVASGFVTPPSPPHLPGRQVLQEQQQAVGMALGSDTLYIWGPAGTGKSTTVADLIAALMRGESVLLVAPTNAAVDCALLKLLRRLGGSSVIERGEVLRLGPIVDDELRSGYGEQISLDTVLLRRRQEMEEQLARLDAEIGELGAEHTLLEATLGRPGFGPSASPDSERDALRATLDGVVSRLSDRRTAAAELRGAIECVRTDVLARCRVLATTVHRTFLPNQFDRDFDAVIIDEAGAVMLPMAVCAASRARKRIICAGDFRQLSAPVEAKTAAARRWLARDVFTLAGIPQLVEQGRTPAHLIMLTRQFRMAPGISWLVNGPVYGGSLIDDASVASRPRGPLGRNSLIYVDTSFLRPRAVRHASGTRTNAMHAFVLRAMVKALTRNASGQRLHGSVAVITPFRGQVEVLRRQLAPLVADDAIEVATVHRFQGDERGIIIADLCDAAGEPLSHFMQARSLDDEAAKLLNVMFTRAKQHIVLVAPFEYLLQHAPADGLLRQFLTRFRQRGRAVDLRELLDAA